jgi:hypothetical protein
MTAALSLLALILAAALWHAVALQRRTSYRLSMSRAVAAQARRGRDAAQQRAAEAIERATIAEARVEAVRKQMLTIAEATAADLAARPGPVRCAPARRISQPAPESTDEFMRVFYAPLFAAQRVPTTVSTKTPAGVLGFVLPWGDA